MDYKYNITDFLNNKIYPSGLDEEIRKSTITVSLDAINVVSNSCSIIFKSILSIDDKNTLDQIVSNHTGEVSFKQLPMKVKIIEETDDGVNKTQGYYQATSIDIDVPATNGTYHKDIYFPYYIAIASAQWFNNIENLGDNANLSLSPDSVIGVITNNANSGDTTISVSDTVLSNIKLGFEVKIGNDELGKVIKVDIVNKTITTEKPLKNNYLATDNIFVYITIKVVDEYIFTGIGPTIIGNAKIGTTLIPPNTIMRLTYTNNNNTAKKFSFFIDYNY